SLVEVAPSRVAGSEDHRRSHVDDLYPRAARASAVALALDACAADRRIGRTNRRRLSYSLLQSDRRLHPVDDGDCGGALSLDRVQLWHDADVVPDALHLLLRFA